MIRPNTWFLPKKNNWVDYFKTFNTSPATYSRFLALALEDKRVLSDNNVDFSNV